MQKYWYRHRLSAMWT